MAGIRTLWNNIFSIVSHYIWRLNSLQITYRELQIIVFDFKWWVRLSLLILLLLLGRLNIKTVWVWHSCKHDWLIVENFSQLFLGLAFVKFLILENTLYWCLSRFKLSTTLKFAGTQAKIEILILILKRFISLKIMILFIF